MSLTANQLADLQSKFGKESLYQREVIPFDIALQRCQKYLGKVMKNDMNATSEVVRAKALKNVDDFVNEMKVSVEGYEDPQTLRKALKDAVIDYSVISPLLNDMKTVDEVRVNAHDRIFYQEGGTTKRYDRKFASREELMKIVNRILGDERLTPNEPFKNARMYNGWRVNATHEEISPLNEYSIVIRKFKDTRFKPEDFIGNQSLTPNMLKLLQYFAWIYANYWMVGPTGSGKTVSSNELILRNIRPTDRTIIIENPTEIRFEQYDADGNVINDFVQFTAKHARPDKPDDPNWPTVNNLIENAMRQTPTFLGVGELRSKEEFKSLLIAMLTGHYTFASFHSDTPMNALRRYQTMYLSASPGEPADLVMANICENMDFIVTAQLFPDIGKRKITSIVEVIGYDYEKHEPKLNVLYEYERISVRDGKIQSRFVRKNPISEKLRRKFLNAGVEDKKYAHWTLPVDETVDEATGKKFIGTIEMTMEDEIL